MLFLDKTLWHFHHIASSWASFCQSNPTLTYLPRKITTRSLPAYLALATCLTILASLLFFSLDRITYRRDGRIWDVDTTAPQSIVVPSRPRDMAANDTLGVSPTIAEIESSLYVTMLTW